MPSSLERSSSDQPTTLSSLSETKEDTLSPSETTAEDFDVHHDSDSLIGIKSLTPPQSSSSTFSGVSAPILRFLFRQARRIAVKALGGHLAASTESAIMSTFHIVDNVNPIAWGKVITWFFHPGRYVDRSPGWGMAFFIRIMFLLTNFVTVFIQYSGLLITPAEALRDSFITDIMHDPTIDGMKYSGFTNHILQTLLLYRPEGSFGRALVSGSRFYMEDVQCVACLGAFAMIFIMQSNNQIKYANIIYAVFLWLDFVLKRTPPQNIARRKIAALANEVRTKTYPASMGSGEIRPSSAADVGFPSPERRATVTYYYALFFTLNAILRAKLYTPMMVTITSKLWRS